MGKKYYTRELIEDYLKRLQISGEGGQSKEGTELFGRIGYTQPINNTSDINIGASGHYVKGKGFKDAGIDRADATYTKRLKDDAELRARFGANLNEMAGKRGLDEFMLEYEKSFKKGGKVNTKKAKSKKVNKPKVRGHGCEKRGKTKGRFV